MELLFRKYKEEDAKAQNIRLIIICCVCVLFHCFFVCVCMCVYVCMCVDMHVCVCVCVSCLHYFPRSGSEEYNTTLHNY